MLKNSLITKALLLLLLSFVVITACSTSNSTSMNVPDGAQAGALSLTPCDYEARDVTYAAECGTIIVPENRNDPASRLIALPITRILSTAANPASN